MTGLGRDDIRDTLEAVLQDWYSAPDRQTAEIVADMLLPVVRRIAADELRAAGRRGFFTQAGQAWAADRADVLDPR